MTDETLITQKETEPLCDHDWKWISDWYGDPSVINGTADCSYWQCTLCGYEDYEKEPLLMKRTTTKMSMTLRETICELTTRHLDIGFICAGQCLRAVGNVGGTIPERPDLTELPMSDVADGGFVTGMALAGKRPIFVIRYQGFCWFNMVISINYAAKSKALWGRPCPMLIRAVANEGSIGPVAGSSHHSLFTRMPGIKVFAPMTPGEWRAAYEEFMTGDDVVYLSEHRGAWGNSEELLPRSSMLIKQPDIALFPISITRFSSLEASSELWDEKQISVAVHHVHKLKPFLPSKASLNSLKETRHGGIIIDDDYPSGVASDIAMQLHALTGAQMRVLGLEDRTAGFAARVDNLPPDKLKIKQFIQQICGEMKT